MDPTNDDVDDSHYVEKKSILDRPGDVDIHAHSKLALVHIKYYEWTTFK